MAKYYYTTEGTEQVVHICQNWSADTEADEDWKVAEIDVPAYESHGVPVLKEAEGEIVSRTAEAIQADIDAIPVPEPTEMDYMRADIDYLLMLVDEE